MTPRNPAAGRQKAREQPQGLERRAGLGPSLRRAWIGYRKRLEAEMYAAGFDERFPNGRVLRMCSRSGGMTISEIGRQLGITRQGASKIVTDLAGRGYVTLSTSAADAREKVVTVTERADEFLAVHRRAARAIERKLRAEVGDEALDNLYRLLDALGADEDERLTDYVRRMSGFGFDDV